MQVIYNDCTKHIGEQCGVSVISKMIVDENNNLIVVPQFCSKDFETERELHAHVYATIVARYRISLVRDEIKIFTISDYEKMYANWYRDFYTPVSHIRLNSMSNHTNNIQLTDERLASFVPELSKKMDQLIGTYMGLKIRKPIQGGSIKSLQEMCKHRTSIYTILNEKIVVDGVEYPLYYYSTNSVKNNELKVISLLREFSFDTCQRGDTYTRIRPYITPALRMLELKLRTQEYYGRFRFHYSPREIITMVRLRTSGGIQNTQAFTMIIDGIKYRVVNSGNKVYLLEAAARELHGIMIDLANDKEPEFLPFNVTKLKPELRYLFEKLLSKIPKALYKVREFFIPSLTLTLLSDLLHKNRMLIERGELITIGCTPWYGGWYQLAVVLNFDNEDIFWVDGDITSLDKHITDWMLYIYLASGARYYAWNRMNRSQRRLLKKLYLLLLYHVTNKVTLQPGNFWRLIRGVMYSGGKETSHGDSWIMALCFFLYIEHIKHMHPSSAPFIHQCLLAGFIAIIVYGDDNIWCCVKALRHLINANSWARFLKEFLGMELRDFKEYDKFLSQVDFATGTMIYTGPRYLKRYFIASMIPNSAPVLPYKTFLEPCVRLCAVLESEGHVGLVLKSLGQAYDSLGTNYITYVACYTAYQFALTKCSKTPKQLYLEWKDDPTKQKILKSMSKKANMKEAEFFESFPSWDSLQKRHAFIPELCNNRPDIFRLSDFF
jgi:hypothetical protein